MWVIRVWYTASVKYIVISLAQLINQVAINAQHVHSHTLDVKNKLFEQYTLLFLSLSHYFFLSNSVHLYPHRGLCVFVPTPALKEKGNTQTKSGQLGNEVHMVHLALMH